MRDYGVSAEAYQHRKKMIEHLEYQSKILELLASHLMGVEIHLPDPPGPMEFKSLEIEWIGDSPGRRRWMKRQNKK